MSNDIFETPEFKEWFAELMQAAIHLATLSQKPIPRPDRAFADGSNAIVGERSEETLISDLRPPELPYTIVEIQLTGNINQGLRVINYPFKP